MGSHLGQWERRPLLGPSAPSLAVLSGGVLSGGVLSGGVLAGGVLSGGVLSGAGSTVLGPISNGCGDTEYVSGLAATPGPVSGSAGGLGSSPGTGSVILAAP